MKSGGNNKQWVHPPDSIVRGHVLYTVKFLGECEVDAPKGTDVVKDAIRKRKFNKSLKKTEGQKTPKVELAISINGVTIQDAKTKMVRHQYPLHRISYCADDKSDKRMFTFIAKAADTNTHYCYVFASDRNAEEITLTIGQAFDLAYRRFLESQGKGKDGLKPEISSLQRKVDALERENAALKQRVRELEQLKDRSDIENYKQSKQPASPKQSTVGRRLENLVFDSPQTNGTNGTLHSPRSTGIISPPPPSSRSRAGKIATPTTPSAPAPPAGGRSEVEDELASVFMSPNVQPNSPLQQDSFTYSNVFDPFSTGPTQPQSPQAAPDPFGMTSFNPGQQTNDFLDLQAGFSQGLSFGTEEFGVETD